MSEPPTDPSAYFEQWQKKVADGSFMLESAHIQHPARIVYTKMIADAGKTVLDVGCGICVDYPRFHIAGIEYFGLDVTPKYLEMAQSTGVPKDHLYLGNVLSLPFSDGQFESVYETGMLEHLPPELWKKAVREMYRVCRKQLLLIFFIPLSKEKTVYQKQAAWTIFWGHQYGEKDLKEFFSELGTVAEILPPILSPSGYYPPETILVAKK
jgi:ubiquinone/menaquinone biosynthesis C-methylase UbiE